MNAKETITYLFEKADIVVNGGRPWDIKIHNENFYSRVLKGRTLALGEAYMDGWWDAKELDQFFYTLLRADIEQYISIDMKLVWMWIQNTLFNNQTKRGSQKVAIEHYDLSPDFYMSFLDPYNQYTCGYFKDTDDLNTAQEQKLDLIARKLRVSANDTLLDIGSGWGGLAKFMAKNYNADVTGITISKEQEEWSREFTNNLPVTIINRDYRDIKTEEFKKTFDKVTTVGMIEHVGYKNYPEFMGIVDHVLKDDGLFLLHTIGRDTSSAFVDPWYEKYIFPNSMLPSPKQLTSSFEGTFVIEDWHNFGVYYDPTLIAWFKNFDTNWHNFREEYGDRFYRMWKYYLLSSAGAFRSRSIELWQIVLSKQGVDGGYERVT